MPEELDTPHDAALPSAPDPPAKRTFLAGKWLRIIMIGGGVFVLLIALIGLLLFRGGAADTYVKNQFREKMEYMGIVFDADVFRLNASPLELELKNATFNDRVSGEKLFFIRDARIGLTILDLFAWQASREISVDSTEIYGAEVWVRFDENGRSNFANIVSDERESSLSFKYDSISFLLLDSVVHFNDASRKIEADARNLTLSVRPTEEPLLERPSRFLFELESTDSFLTYDGSRLEDVRIRATGIADPESADISELRIDTPIGYSILSGRLMDWQNFTYDLNIESSVDLAQTSTIFPLGTTLRGVGNFKGRVGGTGTNYRVEGNITSEALSADGVYLRAVDVAATVAGTNSQYEANGQAVAELFTFEDFRIEFPRIAGNVRGTGTDFLWVGELQAAAAKSGSLTLGGLFLSDAVAELRNGRLDASAGNGRAQMFSVADNRFTDFRSQGLQVSVDGGTTSLSAAATQANTLQTDDYRIDGVNGRNIRVRNAGETTTVDIDGLQAREASIGDARLRNLKARDFELKDVPDSTDLALRDLTADRLDSGKNRVEGIKADTVSVRGVGPNTVVYSDRLRLARVDADGVVLGSLNIAGVRLTIREGRVEARSEDIDAGTVTLTESESFPEGGTIENVVAARPVYVLEPSGRYRATADMSIGGGTLGSINLGSARSSVVITNERAELNDLVAQVMDGEVAGQATIALNSRADSNFSANFTSLDISKLIALQSGRIVPIEGQATGHVDVSTRGTDFRTASGDINADIDASAGDEANGRIPLKGSLRVRADQGLLNVEDAKLNTGKTELAATGRFDLLGSDSDLALTLRSSDASETERMLRILDVSPGLTEQLDLYRVVLRDDLAFDGKITGSLAEPEFKGNVAFESIALREQELGRLSANIDVSALGVFISDGKLLEVEGGQLDFEVQIPAAGLNNTSVTAQLNNISAGRLLTAIPIDLPESLRALRGNTSGKVELRGLPNQSQGTVDIVTVNGTLNGQPFEELRADARFEGTSIIVDSASIVADGGRATFNGLYDRTTSEFNGELLGEKIPVPLLTALLPVSESLPDATGTIDFSASGSGNIEQTSSIQIKFEGRGSNIVVNDNAFGEVRFEGTTSDQTLNASLTAELAGRPQVFLAKLDLSQRELPVRVEHTLDQSPLGPFFALIPQLKGYSIGGTGTGKVEFGGPLASIDDRGDRTFSTANLSGVASFSQLTLQIQESPLTALEPVLVRFSPSEITFESLKLAGGGSNLVVSGTKALTDNGLNNLAIDGRLNLTLLNAFPDIAAADTFFGGTADVSVRLAGVNRTARINGTAQLSNAAVATFIGPSRLSADRITGTVRFTADQAQFDNLSGYLGGGSFSAGGGLLFGDNLAIQSYRVSLTGSNVTVPLPENFVTTGDARLDFTGTRVGTELLSVISGNILARRSVYSRDIELASVIGARREGSLGGGGTTSGLAPRFNLNITGRDALIVRNNIADLTASVSLQLTGTTNNPRIAGRITSTSGTILFRNDRYVIQRGVLEFPPDTNIDPVIFLQAESEINGYQVFVNLSGPLTDTQALTASVRSNPALPEQDVISLITTGSLSNTSTGIPTLASTGLNTAAEVLADSIINTPARRATDRLFGLNVFEIDPIISGERLDPSARLTVGRQINNNLRVTYATNLSQDQNQVIAFEYRVSDRLSFVAQYEQRSLSNVTQNRDNVSFEVRFRRRF
ncbi:MAG: translocation/assembly module TamB domain-containing protein [Acidobacteria bacterium]|nr:translocation/assembly module TamB domain-containing protein [Acidobacteriota bacterium]